MKKPFLPLAQPFRMFPMLHDIQNNNQHLIEIIGLFLLFLALVTVSYYNVEQSLSLTKYAFQWDIKSLFENYALYHKSFLRFLYETSAYHAGSSKEQFHSILYLLPLFIFCDLLGGLSLKAMYLFSITISLLFIGLFYWWLRKSWGKEAALYAAFFLGSSSIFQEFARTGTYHAYSLFIGMIWIVFFFYCSKAERTRNYLLLGILTGITWYGYGTLRFLALVAILYILFLKKSRKLAALGVFLIGMLIILIPGTLIMLENRHIDLTTYPKPLYQLFFDRDSILKKTDKLGTILHSLNIMGHRILGGKEILDNRNAGPHASFWNVFLVIPLLIGLGNTIRLRRQRPNQLLLLLALIIFFAPCLFISHQMSARRYLLCVIPAYGFIGLGVREIIHWVKNIQWLFFKRTLAVFLSLLLLVILAQEMTFLKTIIFSPKRDIGGFLVFVDKIKSTELSGDMYYLHNDQWLVFRWAEESDLMRIALMAKGRDRFNMRTGTMNAPLPDLAKNFYLSKSPEISQKDFIDWCERNSVKTSLVLQSPVIGNKWRPRTKKVRKSEIKNNFQFYAVQQTD